MNELVQLFGNNIGNLGIGGIMLYLYLRKEKRYDEMMDKMMQAFEYMNKVVQRNNDVIEHNAEVAETNTKATEANTVATKKLSDRVGHFLRSSKPRQ